MNIFLYSLTDKGGILLDAAAFKKHFDIRIVTIAKVGGDLALLATDATFDVLCYFGCFETLIQITEKTLKTMYELGVVQC